MKKEIIQQCADSGSEYCPCHLAFSGDCIRCGLLNHRDICDCMWQGVCVYNEVEKSKNQKLEYGQRKENLCKVLGKVEFQPNLYLVEIKIEKELAKELINPGVFILIKGKDDEKFNVPISVMDVDVEKGILYIVIKPSGIKTKGIIDCKEVYIKAPYFNGIFGIREIKTTQNSECLVLLNGLSQVNSVNVIRRLMENNNNVRVCINSEIPYLEAVVQRLDNLGIKINYFDFSKDKDFIEDYITRNNVKLVYSGGNIEFSKSVMKIIDEINPAVKLCISNNSLICCGEGICGACSHAIDNQIIKMCKSQIDTRKYLKSL